MKESPDALIVITKDSRIGISYSPFTRASIYPISKAIFLLSDLYPATSYSEKDIAESFWFYMPDTPISKFLLVNSRNGNRYRFDTYDSMIDYLISQSINKSRT